MLSHVATQVGLVLVALISAGGGIFSVMATRSQRQADVEKSERESEHIGDKTWIQRLEALSRDFEKLQRLSDARFSKLVDMEMLITEHVSWDWRVIRVLRENGIAIDPPPSLVAVRIQIKEAQQVEKEISNGPDQTPLD